MTAQSYFRFYGLVPYRYYREAEAEQYDAARDGLAERGLTWWLVWID